MYASYHMSCLTSFGIYNHPHLLHLFFAFLPLHRLKLIVGFFQWFLLLYYSWPHRSAITILFMYVVLLLQVSEPNLLPLLWLLDFSRVISLFPLQFQGRKWDTKKIWSKHKSPSTSQIPLETGYTTRWLGDFVRYPILDRGESSS